MDANRAKLRAQTDALLAAATGIEQSVGDPAAAGVVAETFAALDEALHLLSSACVEAGSALVAPDHFGEPVARRYARAVAVWPLIDEQHPPPSYEQLATVLVTIHDAANALRSAARSCRVAGDTVRNVVTPSGHQAPATDCGCIALGDAPEA